MTGCSICGRDEESEGFCRYHFIALNNLRSAYEGWRTASDVSWNEYLDQLEQIEETGRWILDVVEHARKQDGS